MTEKGHARGRIATCPDRLWGTITWAEPPPNASPGLLVDVDNTDPTLRSRLIEVLPMLAGFPAEGGGA